MPIENLIKFFRDSVLIQDPEGVTSVDPDFLSMTDEDIILLMQIALTKVDANDDLFSMSSENMYSMILGAKKELYHRLAVKSANKYSITSATGISLTKSDIFNHYYQLIEEVDNEYQKHLTTGGGIVVKTGEILLNNRYFTERNYSLAKKPTVKATVDNTHETSVDISWSYPSINKFAKSEVYVGIIPIVDKYNNNSINLSAKKVLTNTDIHRKCCRIQGLKPDTEYFVAVLVNEKNGLQGFSQFKVKTLEQQFPTPEVMEV